MRYFIIIFLCCCWMSTDVVAQPLTNESAKGVLINIDYNAQLPLLDMSKRFGANTGIGFGVSYKLKSNWIIGVDADYIFSTNVKEDSLLINLVASDGYIVGIDGHIAPVKVFERGTIASLKIGKLLPLGEYKNSGIFVQGGVGYMQHIIKLQDVDNLIPQLEGDYMKGYDRLTAGFALTEYIGYMNLDRNKLLNYYVGIEFIQGFTKGQRDFLFDVKRTDTDLRMDFLIGLKAGWILPIYGKNDDDYYYK